MCHRQTRGQTETAWEDAYYVLSCFNQFELPLESMDVNILRTLIYGLFRPLHMKRGRCKDNEDIEYTRQLLAALATQLRLLRRRGAIPILLSLGTFLLAFIISVVLAFADIVENIDVTPLALGLLWSWLPLLVILTIVDRNPVCSERSA